MKCLYTSYQKYVALMFVLIMGILPTSLEAQPFYSPCAGAPAGNVHNYISITFRVTTSSGTATIKNNFLGITSPAIGSGGTFTVNCVGGHSAEFSYTGAVTNIEATGPENGGTYYGATYSGGNVTALPAQVLQETYWGVEATAVGSDNTACVSGSYPTASYKLGAGAYRDITLSANTYYDFGWSTSMAGINGFKLTVISGGSGSTGNILNGSGAVSAWFSGTTPPVIRVLAKRSNGDWDCARYATFTITRSQPEAPTSISSTAGTIICSGTSTTLSFSGGNDRNGATYEWYAGGCVSGSVLGTGSTITVSPTSTTTYYVRRKSTCGLYTTTCASQTITVKNPPTAPTSVTSSAGTSICSGSSTTLSFSGGSDGDGATYQWYAGGCGSGAVLGTGATLSVSPTSTTTYYVRRVGNSPCGSTVTACASITIYTNDNNTSGVLATVTSSETCIVNDNLWHYFRNTSGDIIAAINSNGQNLGNVTMTVTINPPNNVTVHGTDYSSDDWANGGMGQGGVCNGQNELSMRRWYTITPQFQPPTGSPSTIRLFFTTADYSNYTSEVSTWTANEASGYSLCYGNTSLATDLAVSKNEIMDIPISSTSLSGGPNSSTQYEISVPSFSRFRFHTFGGIGEPLPVELVSFTGWNQNSVNKLKWVTASELNTAYFEIQRNVASGVWEVIGQKLAADNSNAQLTYDFTDNNPVIGDNYYRLKIVDKDGTFKYSNVIDIPINEALVNNFTRIYPNPTGENLNVEIQSIVLYDTKLKVYDVLGKKVFEKPITLSKGLNTLQFDFNQLAQGTYIIQFADADGKLHTTQFVKN